MNERDRPNPWLEIPAADYEGHMGPLVANQSAALADLLGAALAQLEPRRLAILGAGTGNGFERIDPTVTTRLLAIDINPDYLEILRSRHVALTPVLETICAPVEACELQPGSLDCVHAALLFEYVDPAPLVRRLAEWLAPDGVLSTVLQLPSEQPAVTPTPYQSLQLLDEFMRLVEPTELDELARAAGLELVESSELSLPTGKRFALLRHRKRG